jgi:hypothetical protein
MKNRKDVENKMEGEWNGGGEGTKGDWEGGGGGGTL